MYDDKDRKEERTDPQRQGFLLETIARVDSQDLQLNRWIRRGSVCLSVSLLALALPILEIGSVIYRLPVCIAELEIMIMYAKTQTNTEQTCVHACVHACMSVYIQPYTYMHMNTHLGQNPGWKFHM